MQCSYQNCENNQKPIDPTKSITCAYCPDTHYCSSNCQKADWEIAHKFECDGIAMNPELNMVEANNFSFSQFSANSSASTSKKKTLDDYEVVKNKSELGKGTYSKVKLVREKADPTKFFAMKVIDKKDLKEDNRAKNLKREIKIQKKLNHPHVIQLKSFFEDKDNIYLILEYAQNGSLASYLKKKKKLTEKETFVYFFQSCIGVDYLHKKNILHRDIKPENLLLDSTGNIKVSGFGWSAEDVGKRNSFCGTTDYMAPEIVRNYSHDYKVDIWSLGVLLYELLNGFSPFKGDSNQETFDKILENKPKFENLSDEVQALITSLLKSNPTERPDFSLIFKHPWLVKHSKEFKIDIKKFIYDPEKTTKARKEKTANILTQANITSGKEPNLPAEIIARDNSNPTSPKQKSHSRVQSTSLSQSPGHITNPPLASTELKSQGSQSITPTSPIKSGADKTIDSPAVTTGTDQIKMTSPLKQDKISISSTTNVNRNIFSNPTDLNQFKSSPSKDIPGRASRPEIGSRFAEQVDAYRSKSTGPIPPNIEFQQKLSDIFNKPSGVESSPNQNNQILKEEITRKPIFPPPSVNENPKKAYPPEITQPQKTNTGLEESGRNYEAKGLPWSTSPMKSKDTSPAVKSPVEKEKTTGIETYIQQNNYDDIPQSKKDQLIPQEYLEEYIQDEDQYARTGKPQSEEFLNKPANIIKVLFQEVSPSAQKQNEKSSGNKIEENQKTQKKFNYEDPFRAKPTTNNERTPTPTKSPIKQDNEKSLNDDFEEQRKSLLRSYKKRLNSVSSSLSNTKTKYDESGFTEEGGSISGVKREYDNIREQILNTEVLTEKKKTANEPMHSFEISPSKEIQKERIIENPELAINWLNRKKAEKDLDYSFMPRSLAYNYKTLDQSMSDLKKKTKQLESIVGDDDIEAERVSRPSLRTMQVAQKLGDAEQKESGIFSKFMAMIGCFQRDAKGRPIEESRRKSIYS